MAGPHTHWLPTPPVSLSEIAAAITKLSYADMMKLATAIDEDIPLSQDFIGPTKIAETLLKVAARFKPQPPSGPVPR
jgi:hypothetical protein